MVIELFISVAVLKKSIIFVLGVLMITPTCILITHPGLVTDLVGTIEMTTTTFQESVCAKIFFFFL